MLKYLLTSFLMLLLPGQVFSENSQFLHPLRISAGGLYSKIHVNGSIDENSEPSLYERNRNLSLEGEWKVMDYLSIGGGGGRTKYESSGNAPITQTDRWFGAIKFARETGNQSNGTLIGAGVKVFDRMIGQSPRYNAAPDLYIVRPNLAFGYRWNGLEILTELAIQSETNTSFREEPRQEFQRHYQAGLSLAYRISDNVNLYLEMEYREPYEKSITPWNRFWNVYPGFAWKPYGNGMISASFLVPIRMESTSWDHGLKLGYYHFF